MAEITRKHADAKGVLLGLPDAIGGVGGFAPDTVREEVIIDRDDGAATTIYRTGFVLIGVLIVIGLAMLRRGVASARLAI